jgi:RNA polymerase sigma factor (TIGR02999 family)
MDELAGQPADDPVTAKLIAASNGNIEALNDLFPLVYNELRALARHRLKAERTDHTLNTTALVHEAYLRLARQSRVNWQGRAHFYGIASQAMRRILINHAEMRRAGKRGGGAVPVELEDLGVMISDEQAEELLALDEALERLTVFNPRGATVVVQRFFGGMTNEEIAEAMGISAITVRRAWGAARSWLQRELRELSPLLEQPE